MVAELVKNHSFDPTQNPLLSLKAIEITKLPINIDAHSIDRECFLGEWRLDGKFGHPWVGAGTCALAFHLFEPQRELVLVLNGGLPEGGEPRTLDFQCYGVTQAEISISPQGDRTIISLFDPEPFSCFSVTIRQFAPLYIGTGGEALGYFLASVSLASP